MGIFQPVSNLKPSEIADLLVFKTVWQYYPRKSFVSGLWLRDFEKSDIFLNCFCRVLSKGKYPYFSRYLRNIVLLTPGESALWHQATEEERIQYSLDIEEKTGGKHRAEWEKMKALAEFLQKEYQKWFPYTRNGIVNYKYTLEEQLKIVSKLNADFLKSKKN